MMLTTGAPVPGTHRPTNRCTAKQARPAWCSGVPRSPTEFIRPLLSQKQASHVLSGLPAYASEYIDLLRESSSTRQGFTSHLLMKFAKTAVDCSKVSKCLLDPSGALTELAVESAATWCFERLPPQEPWLPPQDGVAAAPPQQENTDPHSDTQASSRQAVAPHAAGQQPQRPAPAPWCPFSAIVARGKGGSSFSAAAAPCPLAAAAAAAAGPTAQQPSLSESPFSSVSPCAAWEKMHAASRWTKVRQLLGSVTAFKGAAKQRAQDDSCLRSPACHLHAKALSVMLSAVVGDGLSSTLQDAAAAAFHLPHAPLAAITSTVNNVTTGTATAANMWGTTSKAVLNAIQEAPSVTASSSGGGIKAIGSLVSAAAHNSSGAARLAAQGSADMIRAGSGALVATCSGAIAAVTKAAGGTELVSLGGAVASAAQKLRRADSKSPIRDLLSRVGPAVFDTFDGCAMQSIEAATTVLEVLVESVKKVEREKDAAEGKRLLQRLMTLPRGFAPGWTRCAEVSRCSGAALAVAKSCST